MKRFKLMILTLVVGTMMTSCYSYTTVVGDGAQTGQEIKVWNHYVIYGLAPVGVSNPTILTNGADNYTVTTKQSFVNGLVAGLTFGIYTPTTTIITK